MKIKLSIHDIPKLFTKKYEFELQYIIKIDGDIYSWCATPTISKIERL